MKIHAIILAAGKGTRMKSEMVKVAHEAAGKPIVNHVIDTLNSLSINEINLVIGHQAELVKQITAYARPTYVLQTEQLGTGHAVMQVEPIYHGADDDIVMVLAGDCPLIEANTLKKLMDIHTTSQASASILTTIMADPGNYGRMLRNEKGTVIGIKEAKDCSSEERKINEINTGIYCFQAKTLFDSLKKITNQNAQKEYYLTDVIHILTQEGSTIAAHITQNPAEVIGINTRMELAEINQIIFNKNNLSLMKNGVTIIDPSSTFIDSSVSIGADTIIYPFTIIQGRTTIGTNSKIGPYTFLKDTQLPDKSCVQLNINNH